MLQHLLYWYLVRYRPQRLVGVLLQSLEILRYTYLGELGHLDPMFIDCEVLFTLRDGATRLTYARSVATDYIHIVTNRIQPEITGLFIYEHGRYRSLILNSMVFPGEMFFPHGLIIWKMVDLMSKQNYS